MQLLFEQAYYKILNTIRENNIRAIKGSDLAEVLVDVVDTGASMNYSTIRPYLANCFCVYNGTIYVSNATTEGTFNPTDWDEIIWT